MDELLGAYALDAVDDVERRRVEAYLAANPRGPGRGRRPPRGRGAARRRQRAPPDGPVGPHRRRPRGAGAGARAAPGPGAAGRPGARRRRAVLGAVAARRRRRGRRRRRHRRGRRATTSRPRAATAAIERAYDDAQQAAGRPAHRARSPTTSRSSADAVVQADGTGFLAADDLPELPDTETWQLWGVYGDDDVISLGVLGNRPGLQAFTAHDDVVSLVITREQAGGVVSSTSGAVLVGQLALTAADVAAQLHERARVGLLDEHDRRHLGRRQPGGLGDGRHVDALVGDRLGDRLVAVLRTRRAPAWPCSRRGQGDEVVRRDRERAGSGGGGCSSAAAASGAATPRPSSRHGASGARSAGSSDAGARRVSKVPPVSCAHRRSGYPAVGGRCIADERSSNHDRSASVRAVPAAATQAAARLVGPIEALEQLGPGGVGVRVAARGPPSVEHLVEVGQPGRRADEVRQRDAAPDGDRRARLGEQQGVVVVDDPAPVGGRRTTAPGRGRRRWRPAGASGPALATGGAVDERQALGDQAGDPSARDRRRRAAPGRRSAATGRRPAPR